MPIPTGLASIQAETWSTNARGETIVVGQPIGLAQRDEMGVAVQFPDDFRIAAAQRIERTQLAPMRERGAFARDGIEAPVNRRIGRIAETQARRGRAARIFPLERIPQF